MKRFIQVLLLLPLIGCSAIEKPAGSIFSCKSYYDERLKTKVYTIVDDMPINARDLITLCRTLSKNVRIKDDSEWIKTRTVSFIVTTTGELKYIKIYEKDPKDYTEFEHEMVRAMGLIPKWTVAQCNGKKVPVLLVIPIR